MPLLLFCFPSPRREQSARHALAESPHAGVLRIATTAIDPQATSPAGPVWLPLGGGYARSVRLIELGAVMPSPPRAAGTGREQAMPGLDNLDDLDDLDDPYGE